MSTLTISSGVHVGVRDDNAAFIDWFSATPTVQFSTVTLTLATVQKLISVEGRLGDDEPVVLRFQGLGLPATYNTLKGLDCRDLLNGRPRTTLSGFRDAMARSGYLVKVEMQLWKDSASRSDWGVLTNVRNTVGNPGWSVEALFHPCSALGWIGTTNWYLDPVTYAELAGS